MQIQPAVKKETARVAAGTGVGVLLMLAVFLVLHSFFGSARFDGGVVLSGIGGGAVAVANFFLMGITVQKIASTESDSAAFERMKASYRMRIILQLVWIVVALVVPGIDMVAAILPLFIPSIWIKILGILGMIK